MYERVRAMYAMKRCLQQCDLYLSNLRDTECATCYSLAAVPRRRANPNTRLCDKNIP